MFGGMQKTESLMETPPQGREREKDTCILPYPLYLPVPICGSHDQPSGNHLTQELGNASHRG